MKSVALIGGGITALTAAFRLQGRHIPVTVYETSNRVGGYIQTIREHGYLAEFGPNTILDTLPQIGALISDLGLNERRWYSNPSANKNYIIRGGRLHPLPMQPLKFLATPLFSPMAKLRLGLEPFLRTPAKSEDESLADFVVRRLGREFLDYAINPFVSGIYAGEPTKLSVRHAFPKLKAVEDKYGSLILGQVLGARERKKRGDVRKEAAKKISFDEGLQVLPDTIHAKLGGAVQLHSAVTALRQTRDGWEVTVQAHGVESTHQHSAVILTAPAYQLAKLRLDTVEPVQLGVLGEIEHPAVARIVLGYRREDVRDALNGFGFLVPEIERFNILGTTFSSSIFAGRAPEGHVTLTSFVGGCRNPELAHLDPEKLFELTHHDLERVLGVQGKPTYRHHCLFPWAIPQYNVGHGKFVDFMDRTEKQLPGFFFAGMYRHGISVGNSIAAGETIAERTATFLDLTSALAATHHERL